MKFIENVLKIDNFKKFSPSALFGSANTFNYISAIINRVEGWRIFSFTLLKFLMYFSRLHDIHSFLSRFKILPLRSHQPRLGGGIRSTFLIIMWNSICILSFLTNFEVFFNLIFWISNCYCAESYSWSSRCCLTFMPFNLDTADNFWSDSKSNITSKYSWIRIAKWT